MRCAVTNPALHHFAYCGIIAAEMATALLCSIGAWALYLRLWGNAASFNAGKTWAIYGLVLGFVIWQVGFMSIGGEWFGMWQSQQWNGVPSAFRFVVVIALVLIFVALPDGEVKTR